MNGKHRNKHIYQIIATILTITIILTSNTMHNFKNIFATDSVTQEESSELINNLTQESTNNSIEQTKTWRESTTERNLYKNVDTSTIGKQWHGETIEEIIEMSKDPSIEFDEENFFNETCFEGFLIEDLEWFLEDGYTLEELQNIVKQYNLTHAAEYLYNIDNYLISGGITVPYEDEKRVGTSATVSMWAIDEEVWLLGLDEASTHTLRYMSLNNTIAFCLDYGKAMRRNTKLDYYQSVKTGYIGDAMYQYYKSPTKTQAILTQLYIWAQGDPTKTAYSYVSYLATLDCRNGLVEGVDSTNFTVEDVKKRINDEYINGEGMSSGGYLEYMVRYFEGYSGCALNSGDEYGVHIYWNNNSDWQRLATPFLIPQDEEEEIEPEIPEDPVPDPEPIPIPIEPVTDTEIIRNRLYVQHNITGSIDVNGEGIIGSWTAPWDTTTYTNNPTTWVCVCGKTTGCTHSNPVTDEFYTKAELESDLSPFSSNHYFTSGSATHNFVDAEYYEEPHEDIIKIPSHYYIKASYETYNEHYCTPTIQHTIYEPSVTNYTLTLHYQGGYFDGETDTQFMNENTYGKTFNNTRSEGLAIDVITTEKTKVDFEDMSIKESFKLNYTTSSQPAYGPAGELEGSEGDRKFTHGSNDGVASIIEFTYKNSYVVSLPTPVRTGYNFLGWFDAAEDGNQIIPTTITNKDGTFNNAYVITEDKTFYAHWELITKDETFTIEWLDNSNNYTTRPDAVYVELYRYVPESDGTRKSELCKGYITERLNTPTADWINNFSNETGINNKGNKNASSLKTGNDIHDPNVKIYDYSKGTTIDNTENNIFKAGTRYYIKISGDNLNPAGSNTWTVTLKDLQKFDTSKEDWVEYQYIIKEVICESLDNTTQYYVSPDASHNSYNTDMSNYYNIKNNTTNNGGQKTLAQYDALDIPTNFSHTIVNRAANVANPLNWKNVSVTVTFKDGPIDNYDDDIYHFRPYSVKIELYQNYAYGKDENSDNYLTDKGVRVLFDREDNPKILTHTDNPYSATIPSSGFLANTLMWTFENVPTVQDGTCIKIAYDVVVTHGQDRYRYTIDTDSNANNLADSMASSHYYANKHKTDINTITDLDYTKLTDGTTTLTVIPTIFKADGVTPDYTKLGTNQVFKCDVKETIEDTTTDYEFVEDNFNDIYQSKLKHEDFTLSNNGQNNRYSDNTTATSAAYSATYKSMAYNMRYYYIEEERSMRAIPSYTKAPTTAPIEKQIEYLRYEETLYWNFTLTLNHPETKLPTEYSGSESSDDRTGVYNGSDNDDFMHTKNTLVISNKIYAEKDQTTEVNKYGTTAKNNKHDYYDNLITDAGNESFLITLKQVEKSWDNSGHDTVQSYNDSKYSKNGYKSTSYNDANGNMTINFVSNTTADAKNFNEYEEIGNEYNIQLPAHGTVVIDYIPDGRYEVTCHYDIDFDFYTMTMTNGTVTFEQSGNEKWYITISSTEQTSTGDFLHKATIDYWRGYVDDENEILSHKTTIKISEKNSWLNGEKNGFNVKENFDEEHPTAFAPDDYWDDYLVPNYKPAN